ncbi:MAG: GAF domain-containing protein [Campylobacterota bacterium]|nr:GAF domain-containing protein [Campylobacterota bacterium]
MIEYKKELSKKEKIDNILKCMKSIVDVEKCTQIVTLLESLVKSLVTAKYVMLWIYDPDRDILCRKVDEQEITTVKDRGLLGRAFAEKKAFFTNDVVHSSEYQSSVDNIDDQPIKDIIFLPILDNNDKVKFVFQAMTATNNIQQFVQSDVDTLNMLIDYIHNIELISCCRDEIEEEPTPEEKKEEEDILNKILNFFK